MVELARHDPAPGLKSLCQSLCQRPPIGPILPVSTVYNCLSVNNLAFWRHHGMEEVVGSIPTRSTKSLNNLADILQIACPHFARKEQIFPRDGTTVFFAPPSVLFFGCFLKEPS